MASACVAPAPAGEVAIASVKDVQMGETEAGIRLRWGGTITRVQNTSELTVLEIVSRPLQYTGQPLHNDASDGRFLAEISGFLDPAIVSVGRDISLVGTVTRIDDGLVGEAEYRFPVMSVFDYRVWKKQADIDAANRYRDYSRFHRDWDRYNWPPRRGGSIRGQIRF